MADGVLDAFELGLLLMSLLPLLSISIAFR
jgi:hypothetical protein